MTTFPYSTIDLTSDQIETILSVFDSLQRNHSVDFKMDFSLPFKEFALFGNHDTCSAGPVIEVKENGHSFFVIFAQVLYQYHSASRNGVTSAKEYQAWCVYPLRRSYGHILIKSETFLDKIHEFVHRLEIDFKEDVDFSDHYYVLASDEHLARSLLDLRFRNCLKEIRDSDFLLEVGNNWLIAGNKKRFNYHDTIEMVRFLDKLSTFVF